MFASLPSLILGEETATSGRASITSEPSNRSAVDRWRRLKSLYSTQESSAASVDRTAIEPSTTTETESARPIPEVGELEQQETALPSGRSVPEPNDIENDEFEVAQPFQPKRAPLPISPLDEEPAWVLPVEVEPTTGRDFSISNTDDGGVHALEQAAETPPPVPESREIAERIAAREKAITVKTVSKKMNQDQQIAPVRYRKIGSISPFRDHAEDGRESDRDIREWARKQSDDLHLAFGADPYAERSFPAMVKAWDAPNFFHYPLYFEDPALERYGHKHAGCCGGVCGNCSLIQPAASLARFSTQLVFLPYQMVIDQPCREVYTLGWYRPGECTPKLCYQPPLNFKAAAVQAATVTGLVFLIP